MPLFHSTVERTRGSLLAPMASSPPQDWPMAAMALVSSLPKYLLPDRLFSATAQSMASMSMSDVVDARAARRAAGDDEHAVGRERREELLEPGAVGAAGPVAPHDDRHAVGDRRQVLGRYTVWPGSRASVSYMPVYRWVSGARPPGVVVVVVGRGSSVVVDRSAAAGRSSPVATRSRSPAPAWWSTKMKPRSSFDPTARALKNGGSHGRR